VLLVTSRTWMATWAFNDFTVGAAMATSVQVI
jgi:hypothetical protein